MIEPTYRRLDEPAKLGPFTFGQWLVLLVIVLAIFAVHKFLPLPAWAVLIPGVYVLGVPAMLMYFSEGERPPLSRTARDLAKGALSHRLIEPGAGHGRPLSIQQPRAKRRTR